MLDSGSFISTWQAPRSHPCQPPGSRGSGPCTAGPSSPPEPCNPLHRCHIAKRGLDEFAGLLDAILIAQQQRLSPSVLTMSSTGHANGLATRPESKHGACFGVRARAPARAAKAAPAGYRSTILRLSVLNPRVPMPTPSTCRSLGTHAKVALLSICAVSCIESRRLNLVFAPSALSHERPSSKPELRATCMRFPEPWHRLLLHLFFVHIVHAAAAARTSLGRLRRSILTSADVACPSSCTMVVPMGLKVIFILDPHSPLQFFGHPWHQPNA